MLGRRGSFAWLLLICVHCSGTLAQDEHVETSYVHVRGPDEIIEGKPEVIVEERPVIKHEVSYLPDEVKTSESVKLEHGGAQGGSNLGGLGRRKDVNGNTRVSVGGGLTVKAKHVHEHTDWISEYAWSAIKHSHKKYQNNRLFNKHVQREKRLARKSGRAQVKPKIATPRTPRPGRQESHRKLVAASGDADCGGRVCRSNEECVTRRSQVKIDQIKKRISKQMQGYNLMIAIEVKKHNAALSSRVLRDTGEKFEHACEGGVLTLSCPAEYIILVLRGFYGRTSDAYCNHGTPKTYQCSTPKATGIVASQCNGKQSCRVNSANSVFGNPCVDTYKYATVTFRCRLSANIRKRYDRERMQLNHIFQLKVKRYHNANVKRLTFLKNQLAKAMRGNQLCITKRKEFKSIAVAIPEQGIMCGRKRCRMSQSCITLRASAKTIAEIAADIKKHDRSYQTKHADLVKQRTAALGGKQLHPYLPEQFNHACQNAAMTVTCPRNYVVQVLRGFYGRRTDAYCNHGKPKTYRCNSNRANSVIASLCNNKNSCTVKSTNTQFGNPCPGTNKYASINYRCKLPFSAQKRHVNLKRRIMQRFQMLFKKLLRWHTVQLKVLKHRLDTATHGTYRCSSKRGLGDLDDSRRRGDCSHSRGSQCGKKRCGRRQKCVRKVSKRRLAQITHRMYAIHNELEKAISIAAHQQRAAINSKTAALYLAEQHKFACEGASITVSCPANYGIQVLKGFYGRTSNAICAKGPRKTLTCTSSKADHEVTSRCNNKAACTVESKNEVFGDPCVGTSKYLTVSYRCRLTASAEKQFKADRARLVLDFNSRIGRLRNSYQLKTASLKKEWREVARGDKRCVRKERRRQSIGYVCGLKRCSPGEKCVVKASKKQIRQLNDSITALTSRLNQNIAVISQHQLAAIKKDTLAIYLGEKFDHACEGASLSIHCPKNYMIQVLRGFYGRASKTFCAQGPRKTLRCSSSMANSRIISACNNKRSCTLKSSNSVFGDPCPGTYKYMTVNYKCRLSSNVEKQFHMRREQLNLQFKKRERALRIVYNRKLARQLRKLSMAKRGGYRCVPHKKRQSHGGRKSRRLKRSDHRRKSHRSGHR